MSGQVEPLKYSGKQILGLSHYLTRDSWIHHGYSYYQDHLSCCVWGRGNGWAVLAITEFLQAAEETGFNDPLVDEVEFYFNNQIRQLLDVQSLTGLWPNILTNNETFLETSASAMFLTGKIQNFRVCS